jgi:hypothetical protein
MSEPARSATTLTDAGRRKAVACRIRTECIPSGKHSLRGEPARSPLPIPPPDGELLLALEILADGWPLRDEVDADISDNTFRNDATGHSYGD